MLPSHACLHQAVSQSTVTHGIVAWIFHVQGSKARSKILGLIVSGRRAELLQLSSHLSCAAVAHVVLILHCILLGFPCA